MRHWFSGRLRVLATLVLAIGLGAAVVNQAWAAVVNNVNVTKGPGWVRINVSAPGAHFTVKELPLEASSDYRSIAIDVHNASIKPGYEPKSVVEVNEGLVTRVRVSPRGHGIVRVYVDVVAYPKYTVSQQGGSLVLGIDAFHMRTDALTPPKKK